MSITSTSVKKKKVRKILSKPSISSSESEDVPTEVTSDLASVNSKSTVAKDSDLEDEVVLAHLTIIRFLQDFTAEAMVRQKRNAFKDKGYKLYI